jgi:exopolyphosphatase/guanosine-5'-triphosphate,3'-diphosphate pyrophosphatase
MNNNHYTIIDLGSNSFHMLTVDKIDNGFSVVSKNKQKVRLASGLDTQGNLDQATMERGWDCLRQFKTELARIHPIDVLITATAALRLAKNNQYFIAQAESILGHPIHLISGIEEAKTIYQGVVFTDNISEQLLVIDIGGASTELIIGNGTQVIEAQSLDMGCVTWLNNFFTDQKLNEKNFDAAITAAKLIIAPWQTHYQNHGWKLTMGASGTIQATQEINEAQQLTQQLTLPLLNTIKQQCILCEQIDNINIVGLKDSRIPVFASGLAILIALFESLNIDELRLSKGALREGLISILFNNQ